MKEYTWEEIEAAVKCCTCYSPNWEDTCGKCPLKIEKESAISSECLDELILALYNQVKKLRGNENV